LTASLALQTWIEGRKYFDRDVDLAGREVAEQERAWLIAEARAARERLAKEGVKLEEPGEVGVVGWDSSDAELDDEGGADTGLCTDHSTGFAP
jgi:hypothetical protein